MNRRTFSRLGSIRNAVFLIGMSFFVFPAFAQAADPIGWLDSANCTNISGWACDPDYGSANISVDLYNGPIVPPDYSNVLTRISAGTYRSDLTGVCGGGYGDHAYIFPTPTSLKDGNSHDIYAFGIDIDSTGAIAVGGNNAQLSGVPKTITCSLASCSLTGSQAWGTGCSATDSRSVTSGGLLWVYNTASGYTTGIDLPSYEKLSCSDGAWTVTDSACHSTSELTGSCSGATPSWGACTGFGSAVNGASVTVSNNQSGYTGSATFSCSNAVWSATPTNASCTAITTLPTTVSVTSMVPSTVAYSGTATLHLSATGGSAVNYYNVRITRNSDSLVYALPSFSASQAFKPVDYSIDPGSSATGYTVTAQACNGAGCTDWSWSTSLAITIGPDTPSVNLSASSVLLPAGGGAVTLTWNASKVTSCHIVSSDGSVDVTVPASPSSYPPMGSPALNVTGTTKYTITCS